MTLLSSEAISFASPSVYLCLFYLHCTTGVIEDGCRNPIHLALVRPKPKMLGHAQESQVISFSRVLEKQYMPLSGLKRVDIFVNLVRADRFNLLPLWVQAVELISVASLALRCHLLSSLSQGPIVLVPEHGFGL